MNPPRKTTREQVFVLLFLIAGGALVVTVGALLKPVEVLILPGGMMVGFGLITTLLWFGAWRWR